MLSAARAALGRPRSRGGDRRARTARADGTRGADMSGWRWRPALPGGGAISRQMIDTEAKFQIRFLVTLPRKLPGATHGGSHARAGGGRRAPVSVRWRLAAGRRAGRRPQSKSSRDSGPRGRLPVLHPNRTRPGPPTSPRAAHGPTVASQEPGCAWLTGPGVTQTPPASPKDAGARTSARPCLLGQEALSPASLPQPPVPGLPPPTPRPRPGCPASAEFSVATRAGFRPRVPGREKVSYRGVPRAPAGEGRETPTCG